MPKQNYLTLDDLAQYFVSKGSSCRFNSHEAGGAISVYVDEVITYDSVEDSSKKGLLPVHLKSCHILGNRNGSYISEDSMKDAIPSFCNRPILGYIHQLDNGEWDFESHNMSKNDDGEYEYEEVPVGTVPESCNAKLEYDEENDKTYLHVDGYIYEEYSKAAEILKSKDQSRVSVELVIEEMSYNADTKMLCIDKFYFNGVTILGRRNDGTEIGEGMLGSNITVPDTTEKQNYNYAQSMIEMGEKLDKLLSRFNIEETSGREAPQTMEENTTVEFETTEDTTTTTEETTEDVTVTESTEETTEDTTTETEENDDITEDVAETEACNPGKKKKKCSIESDGQVQTYEVYLDDVIDTLYSLVNTQYGETDNTYYCVRVMANENTLIMVDYWNDKAYRQSFTNENDVYALTGDRVEVFQHYLTKEEEDSLNSMKASYEELKTYKETIEFNKLHDERTAVVSAEAYSQISKTDEFKTLVKDVDKYSVDELTEKADALLGKYNRSFENHNNSSTESKPNKVSFDYVDENKTKPYGGLFEE